MIFEISNTDNWEKTVEIRKGVYYESVFCTWNFVPGYVGRSENIKVRESSGDWDDGDQIGDKPLIQGRVWKHESTYGIEVNFLSRRNGRGCRRKGRGKLSYDIVAVPFVDWSLWTGLRGPSWLLYTWAETLYFMWQSHLSRWYFTSLYANNLKSRTERPNERNTENTRSRK